MRVSSGTRRGSAGSRTLDATALRELVKDHRQWTALARVISPGGGPHWYRDAGKDGTKGRVMVEVETVPEGIDLTCRLGTCAAGPGTGVWFIPPVGALVAVTIPDGELDHCPVITAVLDGNRAPERAGEERALVVSDVPIEVSAPQILVGMYDGSGEVSLGGADAEYHIVLGNIKDALDKVLRAIGEYGGGIGVIADPAITTNPEVSYWGSVLMPAINEFLSTFCVSRNVKST